MNLLNINLEVKEVHPDTPKVKPMPEEGKRVLGFYRGEWVVLEVVVETPTYEESFEPYSYWSEPQSDMMCIDYYDVTTWLELPEIPTEENNYE